MPIFIAPDKTELQQFTTALFGQDTTIEPANELNSQLNNKLQFGTYISDDNELSAVCICDHEFAAYASAALLMLPGGAAQEAAESETLSNLMLSNLAEVMNIFSRVFTNNSTPHIKLEGVTQCTQMSNNLTTFIETASIKKSYEVTLPKYGSGNITLVTN